MKRVQILLSTYNGERFLAPQLDSLLAQNHPDINILVRDDGSTDGTMALLERYAAEHAGMQVIAGSNVGALRSFMELVAQADGDADYLAFCDQDDVWLNTKVSRAVSKLETYTTGNPLAYFCRLKIVDEELNPVAMSPLPRRKTTFENALVENIVTGCATVFNQAARQVVLQNMPDLSCVIIHDWWFYLMVTAFGTVVYDAEPGILYRQHNANAIGVRSRGLAARIERFRKGNKPLTGQAIALLQACDSALPPQNAKCWSVFCIASAIGTNGLAMR